MDYNEKFQIINSLFSGEYLEGENDSFEKEYSGRDRVLFKRWFSMHALESAICAIHERDSVIDSIRTVVLDMAEIPIYDHEEADIKSVNDALVAIQEMLK